MIYRAESHTVWSGTGACHVPYLFMSYTAEAPGPVGPPRPEKAP